MGLFRVKWKSEEHGRSFTYGDVMLSEVMIGYSGDTGLFIMILLYFFSVIIRGEKRYHVLV